MYQDVVLVTQEQFQDGVFTGQPDPKGALVVTPGVRVGPLWVVTARFSENADLSGLETYPDEAAFLTAHPECVSAFQPIEGTDPDGNPTVTRVSIGDFMDESRSKRLKRKALEAAEESVAAAEKRVLMLNADYKLKVLALAKARREYGQA